MIAADFSMDTTYRTDLRELNELNFARFDAKLEQRAAELGAKIEHRVAELRTYLETRLAEQDSKLNQQRAELVRWMFVFWIGTLAPLAGLIILLTR